MKLPASWTEIIAALVAGLSIGGALVAYIVSVTP